MMTVLLASAVPVNVGVVSVVGLAVVTGVEGAAGGVLSTAKVVLGPAAGAMFPAVSVAVPAAIEIPRLPSPVMPERVTVRVVLLTVVTATVAVAVPVWFNVMAPGDNVIEPIPFASA